MAQIQGAGNFIDIKRIFDILVSRWLLFLVSVSVCTLLAVIYLKTTESLYPVRSSIQVTDQFSSDKTSGGERFISGQELMAGNPEIEDEIGILSSYSLIEKALDSLNFNVFYFKYRTDLGPAGKSLAKEIYHGGMRIVLDTSHIQLINTPLFISFPDDRHYHIELESSNATAYNLSLEKVEQKNLQVIIDETLPMGQPFKNDYLHFTPVIDSTFDHSEDYGYFFEIHSTESLAKNYSSKLKISPISKGSNIVNLIINGSLPEKEIDFLNALGKEYINSDFMNENQLGLKTIEFIDDQLALIYDSLEMVENNLKNFRQTNQIVDIPTSSSNFNAQLEQLEEEQAKLLVQQKYLDYTLENLKNNEEIIDVIAPSSVGLNDAFLNTLMIQLSDLNKEKISKSYSAGKNSLVAQVLAEKIINTKTALRENVINLRNSTRISLAENKRRMNRILSSIRELPESERDLVNINRKFAFNDNIYNYLLEKRAEAGIALASNLPDKRIIDRARLSSNQPVSPDKNLILLGAFAVGISLPVALILGQQFLNNRLTEPSDIERLLKVPVIGTFQRLRKRDAKKLVTFHGDGQVREAFRYLLIDLKQDYDVVETKIIGITSFENGDGKTFCASNLAATFAKAGYHTLMIDTDVSTTNGQGYFQLSDHKEGLMQHLLSGAEVGQYIREVPIKNLHYLPIGINIDAAEKSMLNYEGKFVQMLTHLKKIYDVIIVDTPAIGRSSDYFMMAHVFAINLLVVRHDKTKKQTIERIIPHLLRKKISHLKVLYNDLPSKRI